MQKKQNKIQCHINYILSSSVWGKVGYSNKFHKREREREEIYKYPLLHVTFSFNKSSVCRPSSSGERILLGLRFPMFNTQYPIGHSHNYRFIFMLMAIREKGQSTPNSSCLFFKMPFIMRLQLTNTFTKGSIQIQTLCIIVMYVKSQSQIIFSSRTILY